MDELQRKVEKYEAGLKDLMPKMREMQKEKDQLQKERDELQKERDELHQKATVLEKERDNFKWMYNHVMNIVKDVLENWPVEQDQKRRKCDDNSDGEECDKIIEQIVQLRTALRAKTEYDGIGCGNTNGLKRLNEGATKWKIRIAEHIHGPNETWDMEDGWATWVRVGKYMAKEMHNLEPCVEEVALEIVKPLVDEYAEKVLKRRMRLHLTTRQIDGWRVIVLGWSDTFGTEVHLVPERQWAYSRVWPC